MVLRCLLGIVVCVPATGAGAVDTPATPKRFESLLRNDPSASAQVATLLLEQLPSDHPLGAAWKSFVLSHGGWRVHLDRRSGAPLLAEGPGIPWIAGPGNSLKSAEPASLDSLEKSLRAFIRDHTSLLMAKDDELVLDREASGQPTPYLWQVFFRHEVGGVPVSGDRYLFYIGHGNLIAFGASRWTPIPMMPAPAIAATEALSILNRYMGLGPGDGAMTLESGRLVLLPMAVDHGPGGPYQGPLGAGYAGVLGWRQVVRVDGIPGTWVGLVGAADGNVLAFYDDDRYAEARGGVYPESPDGICPTGCEQVGYPMPFADIGIQGGPETASSMGTFSCRPSGNVARTTLSGPMVRIDDFCGPVSQSVTCESDLDLGVSPGQDCMVAAGSSPGNTRAARTAFYHLARMAEKVRAYLPGRPWLSQPLDSIVNFPASCNAYWNGNVNFYASGNGCTNTGENPGVIQHEWGHGLDKHDGGNYDNPSEGYADIAEFMTDHTSCIGRGFRPGQPCAGYGNPCLECTGLRDMDWDRRQARAPATPVGLSGYCPSGDGPCLLEGHCEGSIGGESLWDLATRDLPAAGLEPATAWLLAEKLWFTSRSGSGGNAYNCALPVSDGCNAGSWFSRLRIFDDDDGSLANGTPHAAAIYAAFRRHEIACGEATDDSNQSTTGCPAMAPPALSVSSQADSIALSWTAVPGAASYLVLRNEFGCSYSFSPVGTVSGTTFTDTGLASRLNFYYRVQAQGADPACTGTVSDCLVGGWRCLDVDGDGFGGFGSSTCAGGALPDCDDANPAIYPGAPQLCDGLNNDCGAAGWPALVGTNEADHDQDGRSACVGDCNDADATVWAIPGAADGLAFSSDAVDLTWGAPREAGGTGGVRYDTIRSSLPSDFATGGTCIEMDDGSDFRASDPELPSIDQVYYYLVRGGNSCGDGDLGTGSDGRGRTAPSCP